jgi:hypothetical protein
MTWPNPSMTRWLMNSRRSTTGDLRRFAVHEIVAYGLKLRGASFGWHWSREGKTQASIGASVQGGEYDATLVLNYTLNGSPVTPRIRLAASPCRFGGVRWLAICPNTGRCVAHLYIGGSGAFSRHAYGLAFNSQRECPLDRSLRRRDKALAKLNADSPMGWGRPKGMHSRTYERLMQEVFQEEEFFDVAIQARFGSLI